MRNSGLKVIAFVAGLLGSIAIPAQVAAQRSVELLNFTTTSWHYKADGSDQGTAWQAKAFDDSTWLSGFGLFGYEPGNPQFYAYPILTDFGSFYTPNTLTYYFRAHFTMQASNFNQFITLAATNYADDSCVVYLNGTEVQRIRVPAGQTYTTQASAGPAAEGQYEIYTIATNALLVGDNVVAVEVHQLGTGSSDVVFGMNLYANTPPFTAIAFTSQPTNQTATVGSAFTLNATTSGGPVFYQWQTNNGAGVYVNVLGATSSNYFSGTLTTASTNRYRLIASNSVNVVTSSVAIVSVVPDTFGPLVISACVLETNGLPTNRIEIVFSETLNSTTVHSPSIPGVLTNDTFRVVMFASNNVLVTVTNSTYVPGNYPQPNVPLPKVVIQVSATNWFYRSNYYIILNNVRDSRGNVIAPNTIIPVCWPIATNIFTPDFQPWIRHDTWGFYVSPEFDPNNPGVYTNAWTDPTYYPDPALGWSDPKYGFFYWDEGLNGSCFGGLNPEKAGGQDQPTLFRTWFMWPSNGPSSADLKFSYSADDAAAFYVNGSFLFSDTNFPAGAIDNTTRATSLTEGACKTNLVRANVLRPGSNLLAVAIAQYRPHIPPLAGDAPADAAFDFVWTTRLDATTMLVGPLPPTSLNNRLTLTNISPTIHRITWPTNAYGWALVYTTNFDTANIIKVGNTNYYRGPWLQEPNMRNTLGNTFMITNTPGGARRIYGLVPTQ